MNILFIIPGSGDQFYCGNCFRDQLYASALRDAGHEVVISPLYLPLKYGSFKASSPLFFPATTQYVEHKFFAKGTMPTWMRSFTGANFMLDFAMSKSGTTSSKGLEKMTLSMIEGEDPVFQLEIKKLIEWIKHHHKPDVIHLSSSLLIGIAKALRQHLDIPIVCSLQDEEVWIDDMETQYAELAWQRIDENMQYIDQLITTSFYYQSIEQQKLTQPHNIAVLYPGFDLKKYESKGKPQEPTIGFFYRMNEKNGLHILVDAFIHLKNKGSIPNLKLNIGGGYNADDLKFLKALKKKLAPFIADVDFNESYNPDRHEEFFKSISIISVPLTFDEGIGLYICEAFAAEVPAVMPATGSFPEVVADAGILYPPNSYLNLAEALEEMLRDETQYLQFCMKAKNQASTRYNKEVMVEQLMKLYHKTID